MSSSPKISSNSRRHGRQGWSVFDMIKPFPPTPTPETLIPDIDAAIAASEHAHSSSLLLESSNNNNIILDDDDNNNADDDNVNYDARLADDAYKSACAALASRRHDAAARSLKVAIANCPPNKTSALAKLKSLLDIAHSQLDSRNQQQ